MLAIPTLYGGVADIYNLEGHSVPQTVGGGNSAFVVCQAAIKHKEEEVCCVIVRINLTITLVLMKNLGEIHTRKLIMKVLSSRLC